MDYQSHKYLKFSNVELWEQAHGLDRRAKREKATANVSSTMREIRFLMPILMDRLQQLDPKVGEWVRRRDPKWDNG